MKKKIITRIWIVFASILMLIMGVGFFNWDSLSLALGNTNYYVRHPSSALWVCIISASLAAILSNIIEVLINQRLLRVVVASITSFSLFILIVCFVYRNPEGLTSSDRTRIGITQTGHDHTYRVSNTYFWDTERDMQWAGDKFAEILKKSKSERGTVSEYQDAVLIKDVPSVPGDSQSATKEEMKAFRCETKKLSWDMPIVHYKEIELNIDYGVTLEDLKLICSEVKETDLHGDEVRRGYYYDDLKVYKEH